MNKIITVLRSGGEYRMEHVTALHANLRKSLTVPFKFYVLTDVMYAKRLDNCTVIPIIHDWQGWWSKLELFRPGLFNKDDVVVYMDLDTVLVGNVDWLFEFKGNFMMLHGFKHPRWASGLMGWKGEPDPRPYQEFDPRVIALKGGDQAFIMNTLEGKVVPEFWQHQFPGKVVSYKHHVANTLAPSEDSVVCFHGRPRPWDVDEAWIKEARA